MFHVFFKMPYSGDWVPVLNTPNEKEAELEVKDWLNCGYESYYLGW